LLSFSALRPTPHLAGALAWILVSAVVETTSAQPTALGRTAFCAPTGPPPVVVPEGPRPLDDHPDLAAAAELLDRGDATAAKARLERARLQVAPERQPHFDYLMARCELALGLPEAAVDTFGALEAHLPEASPHLRVLRAQAALARGRPLIDDAGADALLSTVPPGTHGAFDLDLRLARRALDDRRPEDAARALDRAAAGAAREAERGRAALMRVAVDYARHRDAEARHAALAAVFRGFGRTSAAREARDLLAASGWPAPVTCVELVDQAVSDAARGFKDRRLATLARSRCAAVSNGLPALLDLLPVPKRWRPDQLARIEKALKADPGAAVLDHLLLARAHSLRKAGRVGAALAAYRAAGDEGRSAPHRGRAYFHGAKLARKLNLVAEAEPLVDGAVTFLDPARDAEARAEALWMQGWLAWRAGAFAAAEACWRRLGDAHAEVRDQSRRPFYERATYWRARALARLGQDLHAWRLYWHLRARAPLTYYGVLAHARLNDGNPLVPRDFAGRPSEAQPPRVVGPEASVGLWLGRLGLTQDARAHLRAHLLGGRLRPAGTLLLSSLYAAQDEHAQSFWVVEAGDPLDVWPVGEDRHRWLAAFPRPFVETVEHAAAEHRVDPHLVWAVMRQESAFKPQAESRARALGLMQLLLSTARDMARRFGEPRPNRRAALDPETNVRYGAAYLRRVLDRYDGNPALALAAYNAGAGNVDDWLARLSHLEGDEFVEEIPFDEANGYVRKVLRSYAAYRALYDEDPALRLPWILPGLPEAPPARPPASLLVGAGDAP
jgi:soluble lytic murein transglycosylase